MGVDSSIYREDGVVRCWYAGPDIDLTADLPGNNQYMVGSQGPSEVAKLIIGKPCRRPLFIYHDHTVGKSHVLPPY